MMSTTQSITKELDAANPRLTYTVWGIEQTEYNGLYRVTLSQSARSSAGPHTLFNTIYVNDVYNYHIGDVFYIDLVSNPNAPRRTGLLDAVITAQPMGPIQKNGRAA